MAKIIEFNIPQTFRKASKWLPPSERGKLLEFPVAVRTPAWRTTEPASGDSDGRCLVVPIHR